MVLSVIVCGACIGRSPHASKSRPPDSEAKGLPGAEWFLSTARRPEREAANHANREDRGPALRRRLADLVVPQDHHRRRRGRLVGVQRELWQPGPDRGDPEARRAPDRPRPAAGRADHGAAARDHPPGAGRAAPAGDRGDRERAGRRQGAGARRAGCGDARAARCATACGSTGRIAAHTGSTMPRPWAAGRCARSTTSARSAPRCANKASARSRPTSSASTAGGPTCTSRASPATRAGPSSTSTAACCGSSATRWRRSARAPARMSTCCST